MTTHSAQTLRILAFDTSSPRGSICLLEGTVLQAELKQHRLQNHSSNLIRSVDFLLKSAHWKLEDVQLVATGIGPGSFTGIRIGIATGLGIAQSHSIPFVGVSGLEAVASQCPLDGTIGVLLDAHRDQLYYAEYEKTDGKLRVARRPSLENTANLPGLIQKKRMILMGDTVLFPKAAFKISKNSWPRILETDLYMATAIGRRALLLKRRWKTGEFIHCEPLYIRPPDALKNRKGRRQP
jgi:tRNA threonylcarbamoyladenosine biosynthesis protein TsaB